MKIRTLTKQNSIKTAASKFSFHSRLYGIDRGFEYASEMFLKKMLLQLECFRFDRVRLCKNF